MGEGAHGRQIRRRNQESESILRLARMGEPFDRLRVPGRVEGMQGRPADGGIIAAA